MSYYWVYILTNKTNTTLYIGVTNDLANRLGQHRSGTAGSFTKKYNLCKPVYFERYEDLVQAQQREKQLKKWNRQWKIDLIETINPAFDDLSLKAEFFG